MLEEGVVKLLATSANVTSLLGTNRSDKTNGVFPVLAPKEVTVPYIVYSKLSEDSNETLEGLNAFQTARFRFKCYAADYPTAVKLQRAVKLVLGGYSGTLADADATPLNDALPVFVGDVEPEEILQGTIYARVIDFDFAFVDTATS